MPDLRQFRILAAYNRWINERLYDACARVPDAERRADRGAFFRSIHGTLNHLLLGDRLWLSRFRGEPFEFRTLADELYADFAELRRERQETDQDIERWVGTLDAARMRGSLTFISASMHRQVTCIFGDALMHFFNHQTHHRGQITCMLSQCGVDYGPTDMLWLPGFEAGTVAGGTP